MEKQEHSPFDDYHVLLLEENEVLAGLFETWLSEASPHSVSTLEELNNHLDENVAAVCLSQSLLGENEEEVRKRILNMNPYCQLILVLPRETMFSAPFEDHYDACLVRPLFKEELQTTVEERLQCGIYSALLREFYHLNAKLIWLQREDAPDEPPGTMNPDKMVERYQDVRSQLHWLQNSLNIETIHDIMRSLDLHKRYLQAPAKEKRGSTQSKHHPPRCPQCKLPWGVNHRNELKTGFDRVGAHVWKCRKCNNIVHGLGESHRSVAPN